MDRAPPRIFDRRRAAAKWQRARDRGAEHYLTRAIADDIAERIAFMQLDPARSLVIGADAATVPATDHAALGVFDEEVPIAESGFDLIVHLLGLGTVNDLPGALIHFRRALAEDGVFIAAFPGAGSVPVLRRLALAADADRPAARIHPQVDIRAGTALLERAGFRKQVVDSYPLKVRFSSALQQSKIVFCLPQDKSWILLYLVHTSPVIESVVKEKHLRPDRKHHLFAVPLCVVHCCL